jgi:hypothetical protein
MELQETDLEASRNHCDKSESSASIQTEHTTVEETNIDTAVEEKTKKKMDLLANPIFSGFLLIVAGCALAIQAGMSNSYYTHILYINSNFLVL